MEVTSMRSVSDVGARKGARMRGRAAQALSRMALRAVLPAKARGTRADRRWSRDVDHRGGARSCSYAPRARAGAAPSVSAFATAGLGRN